MPVKNSFYELSVNFKAVNLYKGVLSHDKVPHGVKHLKKNKSMSLKFIPSIFYLSALLYVTSFVFV